MSEDIKDVMVKSDNPQGGRASSDEPKCHFPGCRHVGEISHNIKMSDEENAFAQLPFCWYHYYIVIGDSFTAHKTGKWEFGVAGPVEIVQIAEQVMAAREMVASMKAGTTKPVMLHPDSAPLVNNNIKFK